MTTSIFRVVSLVLEGLGMITAPWISFPWLADGLRRIRVLHGGHRIRRSDPDRGKRFDIQCLFCHRSLMQSIHFEESVAAIQRRDTRYDGQAFFFLKDALDFTLKRVLTENGGQSRHVSGRELLEGFRDYALEQYGPMAATLMDEWGLKESRDVGNMVFLMIEEQVFGKQESDSPDDFDDVYDFCQAFREPFLPSGKRSDFKARPAGRR